MSTVKQFLLKKFPTNQYMDCPIPKEYWEIMQEYAEWYALDNKAAIQNKVSDISAEEEKCVTGCIHYTGGEIYHHKDCPFYSDSFSRKYDELNAEYASIVNENKSCGSGQERWHSTDAFVAACKAAGSITEATGGMATTIDEMNTFQELLKEQGFSILPMESDSQNKISIPQGLSSEWFAERRKKSGLTLRQVEEGTGISNPYLSQLENGKMKNPSFSVVQKLNDFYNDKNKISDVSVVKPCPFCNKSPYEGRTNDGRFTIKCYGCGVEMVQDRKDKVRGIWNKREYASIVNKTEDFEEIINSVYKRHKIDLKNPHFDIATVNEMIYDALKVVNKRKDSAGNWIKIDNKGIDMILTNESGDTFTIADTRRNEELRDFFHESQPKKESK